jgi:tRNA 2-selenouridine synthase
MPTKLSIEEFLPLTDTFPLVDVRSPAEYAKAHIPGAVNIPLFDNEERKQVGIRYKQGGKENAVLLGLEYVGPKMAGFVKQAKKLVKKDKKILIHCWRGGMRSGSMAWLFETAGLKVFTLDGGYKAYRGCEDGQRRCRYGGHRFGCHDDHGDEDGCLLGEAQ